MPDSELRLKVTLDPGNSSTKSFLDAVNNGINLKTTGSPSGGASATVDANNKETKGLLSKIVAGIVIGNGITSTFQDFLRPIFQMFKAVLVLLLLPFIPLLKPISEAFKVIFPELRNAMVSVSEEIKKFTTASGLSNVFGFGDSPTTSQKQGPLTGEPGSIVDMIVGWAQKVDVKAIATAVGLGLGALAGIVFGLPALPVLVLAALGALIVPPLVDFWGKLILGIIEFLWSGIANIYATVQAQWDSATQMITQMWPVLIQPKIDAFVKGFVTWIDEMRKGLLDGIKAVFNFILSGIFGAINSAIGFLKGLGVGSLKPFSELKTLEIPHLDTGGTILETGIAKVHKGETVVPAGGGTGTINYNPTYHISGWINDEQVKKMMREHDKEFLEKLRQRTSTGGRFYVT